MKNELFDRLSHLSLKDAIEFENNDRQFIALKNLWENIEKRQWKEQNKIFFYLSIIIWNSLVCYQLSGKWEDYWTEFWEYFSDKFDEKYISPRDIILIL